MKNRSGRHGKGGRRADQRKRGGKERGARSPTSGAAQLGAILLTGSFAIAQVPVYAAGGALPVPCAGSNCISGTGKALGFDLLGTHSTLTSTANSLTINQNAGSAIFNWQSFNISAGNTVRFIQPSSSSVALNRIFDPNATTIAGNLKANGQIYLINPNGILFGSGANVDVGGLIAATSNLSDTRITSGLLFDPTVADPVFTNSAAALGASAANTPVASSGAAPSIVVQQGATLYAAGRNAEGTVVSAGRVFLFAPTVENAGKITVDGGGQVILAAGSDVYLGSSNDPSLRGLLVEVTGSTAAGVSVDPSGTINVAHGNITLMGLAVNQAGSITATSALDANGSIRLIARQADPTANANTIVDPDVLLPIATTGEVTLAPGSKTVVAIDPSDTATAPLNDATAAALRSTIDIEGRAVNIGGNGAPGSTLVQAHGGDITVTARQASSSLAGTTQTYQVGDGSVLGTQSAAATINVGADALIDASGLQNVAVDGSRYFTYISRLTSLNLANAPFQRTGFLLGQGVYINLNKAPSWINVSNLLAAVAGTEAERDSVGGTVSLRAEGSVNLAKGSVVNISGGSTVVSAAVGRTSQLLTATGAVVDIGNASADTQYIGFADGGSYTAYDSREGVNQTTSWQIPKYTAVGGYTQGSNAGTLQIYAPIATLGGTLLGQTTTSAQQRSSPPLGGQLQIGSNDPASLDKESGISRPNIVIETNAQQLEEGIAAIGEDGATGPTLALDAAALQQGGFTRLDLTSDGAVVLAPGTPLNLGPAGVVNIRANAVNVDSSITAPNGTISIVERPKSVLHDGSSDPTGAQRDILSLIPEGLATRGAVTIAPGTTLSTAGLWTNDALDPGAVSVAPIVLSGGSISISSRTVDVSGARFDVSSGAWLSSSGAFSGGSGGKLSLAAVYNDPVLRNPDNTPVDSGALILGSDFAARIAGFGVQSDGSLALQGPSIVLGGSTGATPVAGVGGTVYVDPAIAQSGFQSYTLSGVNSLAVAPGTSFVPDVLKFANSSALRFAASTGSLRSVDTPLAGLPGVAEPVTIALAATNGSDGTANVGKGAIIDAGATGSITLSAGVQVDIDGALIAPAGTVSAKVTGSQSIDPTSASAASIDALAVQLGPDASIDVSGVSLVTASASGVRSGSVLDAGSVALDAPLGTVAIDPGATIKARGTVDTVDILGVGARYVPTTVASNGGTVEISATLGAYVEGTVDAHAGNASANGGNLSVALQSADPFFVENAQANSNLGLIAALVAPTNFTIGSPQPLLTPNQAAFAPPVDANGKQLGGQGSVTTALINSSGFENVWLQSADQISFAQTMALHTGNSLVLSAQTLNAAPGAAVTVSAPYVALGAVAQLSGATSGYSFNAPVAATAGTGTLQVNARQIDLVGALSLSDIGLAVLDSAGAVRGIGAPASGVSSPRQSGSLQFGGNLYITAQEFYPATQSDFAITTTAAAADSANGQLQLNASAGTTVAPLSAGGTMTITVNDFSSSGRLLAPLGSIEIDAPSITLNPGSLLSVAGSGLVPYGTVLNGNTWTYNAPASNSNEPVTPYVIASTSGTNLPSKGITLNANTLDAQSGAVINVGGGGDVLGVGFTAGPGGSYDYSQNFPYTTSTGTVSTTRNPFFALVPTLGSGAAPYDPQIFSSLVLNSGLPSASNAAFHIGQTITIGSGSGLPAGTYTVLPPSYALLPGAYAVEAASGYQNLSPTSSVNMPDGSVIVAGRLGYASAGTGASLWSGYRVYTEAQYQSFSQFTYFYGSQFFATAATAASQTAQRLGPDAGTLQIDANQVLLAASLDAAPVASGRGADIAIDAPNIVVVDGHAGSALASNDVLSTVTSGQAQGTLDLSASALSALGAQELVLGATEQRSGTTLSLGQASSAQAALTVPALAASVSDTAAATLSAGEVVLAGSSVTIGQGAAIVASKAGPPTTSVSVNGDGALVYAGNAVLASYVRSGGSPSGTATTGALSVGANATISGKTVVFDSTFTQSYDPSFAPKALNLLLSAPLVNFGAAPAGTTGVDLGAALLEKFSGSPNLTIVSQAGFDVYGGTTIGQTSAGGTPLLSSLTLVGPGISGFGAAGDVVTINASHVALDNSAAGSVANAGTGVGQLIVNALAPAKAPAAVAGEPVADGNVTFSGNIALDGFAAVAVNATGRALTSTQTAANTGDIVFDGKAGQADSLTVANAAGAGASTLALNATRITAQTGVNATLSVPGALTIGATGAASTAQAQELGAKLVIDAQNVDIGGRIDLPAGVLEINTTGTAPTDGITLESGALLRVAGITQTFVPASSTGTAVTADVSAGIIALNTSSGSILEKAGATVDISGSGTQGDAGTLDLLASTGTVAMQGALAATPGTAARGADIAVDAAALGNASALLQVLAQSSGSAGADAVSLRARSGDIVLGSADVIKAQAITLEADGAGGATDGSIRVAGTLDASGANGGSIALYGNDQVVIQSGGVLEANATSASGTGGQVLISARVVANPATTLDAIVLEPGSSINVAGGTAGTGGLVTLRAPRIGSDVAITAAAGSVSGTRALDGTIPLDAAAGVQAAVAVEAVQVYAETGNVTLDPSVSTNLLATMQSDSQNYAAAALTPGTGIDTTRLAVDLNLQPTIEVDTPGSITVTASQPGVAALLDFAALSTATGNYAWRYGGSTLTTSTPGALALRAGGGITIATSISDGFAPTAATAKTPLVLNGTVATGGESWSYLFTAGADLTAANPNRTGASGDLTIGTGSALKPVTVRTGTGSIDLNAAGSVILDNAQGQQSNTVYTAGVANVAGAPAFPAFTTIVQTSAGKKKLSITPVLTQYGGSIDITAGANVVGTDAPGGNYAAGTNQDGSAQEVNDWLLRGGQGSSSTPTVWWVYYPQFQQGFGALGGGNLSISAGGDVVRVGAVVAGNGYDAGNGAVRLNNGALRVTAAGNIEQGLYYDEGGAFSVRADALVGNANAQAADAVTLFAVGSGSLVVQARESSTLFTPFNPTASSPSSFLYTPNAAAAYQTQFFTYGDTGSFTVQLASGDLSLLPSPKSVVLPPNLQLEVFGGQLTDRNLADEFFLYPSSTGQLRVLAEGDITNLSLVMSQADRTLLGDTTSPVLDSFNEQIALGVPEVSSTALHADDPTIAAVVSRTGSLNYDLFNIPKTTDILAAGDIGPSIEVEIQNSNADSLSIVSAGRTLNLSNPTFSTDHIFIGGPGAAEIVSGGAMNLGTDGGGIDSRGNLDNGNLPAAGATLIVAAGAGQDSLGFASRPDYLGVIQNFLRYDAFASTGTASAALNAQVLAAIKADPALAPLATALAAGLADRGALADPQSAVNQELAALTPAVLAKGAVKLASSVQVANNLLFVDSANNDTFAPAYVAFGDLFPALNNNTAALTQFVANNPFANASNGVDLRNQALQGLPASLLAAIEIGLADPAAAKQSGSAFQVALAALDPATLAAGSRQLMANVLAVAGTSLNSLRASNELTGSGSPYAKELTALAAAFEPTTLSGVNDLSMDYNEIKTEQTGTVAVFAPQGSVVVGSSNPPVLDQIAAAKTADQLGIFSVGGGDIIGMVRNDFNVFQSRVFTVAGGDIDLWSSLGNIDAGRGPRDVAVAAPPRLVTDANGVTSLDLGSAVTGSGIGALETIPNQPPSNINLMAPAGYVDAGEAGIRAQTGTVILGTNLVLNAGNIQAASGVSGGAVAAAPPPPPPPSTGSSQGDRVVEEAQREAMAQQQAAALSTTQRRLRIIGEFIGFEDCSDPKSRDCVGGTDDKDDKGRN